MDGSRHVLRRERGLVGGAQIVTDAGPRGLVRYVVAHEIVERLGEAGRGCGNGKGGMEYAAGPRRARVHVDQELRRVRRLDEAVAAGRNLTELGADGEDDVGFLQALAQL